VGAEHPVHLIINFMSSALINENIILFMSTSCPRSLFVPSSTAAVDGALDDGRIQGTGQLEAVELDQLVVGLTGLALHIFPEVEDDFLVQLQSSL
jgi:hypothetical protein